LLKNPKSRGFGGWGLNCHIHPTYETSTFNALSATKLTPKYLNKVTCKSNIVNKHRNSSRHVMFANTHEHTLLSLQQWTSTRIPSPHEILLHFVEVLLSNCSTWR